MILSVPLWWRRTRALSYILQQDGKGKGETRCTKNESRTAVMSSDDLTDDTQYKKGTQIRIVRANNRARISRRKQTPLSTRW